MESTPAEIAAVLATVGDRISRDRREDVADYLDHREWGLAVDILGDSLFEAKASLSPTERSRLRAIIESIGESPTTDYDYLDLS